MTPSDQHLAQLARAASHSALGNVRWFRIEQNVYWSPVIDGQDTCVPQSYAECYRDHDAAFIAAASPSTVLDLLARLRAAEEEVGRLSSALMDACVIAEHWIPNMGAEPATWKAAREKVAALRKLAEGQP